MEYYNKADQVDYMKFIAKIIKDAQNYLSIVHPKRNLNSSEIKKDTFYNLKNNLKSGRKANNWMNRSCSNDFFPIRKLNISK